MRTALDGAPWLSVMARVFADTPLYAVGGAVRNPLMGLPLSDIDLCGPATPDQVCALCADTPVRAVPRAAHFGTIELHVTDASGARHMAEYTTFRQDSYRCGHRPESVRFTTDLRVDALRRDFSVNALYRRVYSRELGEVIDPTGGLAHLRAGVLHTVTDDPDRVLSDDGLRILRAARFQAELDLRPTDALKASLRRHAPLLRDIARERLRDEWHKTLMADLRYPMLSRRAAGTLSGLTTIEAAGAWPYLAGALPFDAEAAEALSRLRTATLPARLALLLRRAPADTVEAALLDMRFSRRDARDARRFVRALGLRDGGNADWALLGADAPAFALDAFEALSDVEGVCRVRSVLARLHGKPLSVRELAVTGEDLKPFCSGPAIGRALDALWREAIEGRVENTKEALLAWIRAREWQKRT